MNTAVGTVCGAVYGSVVSAWVAPKIGKLDGVELSQDALPSFRTMTRHVGGHALIFGGVAAAFSVGEAVGGAVRGVARTKTIGHGLAFTLGFGALSAFVHLAH